MAGVLFITPYDPKNWEQRDAGEVPKIFAVDVEEFKVQLKNRWPTSEIRYAPSDAQVLIDWSLAPTDSAYGLNGSLFSDHETLTIETGVENNLVEFILWYRKFIIYKYKLYIFNDVSFERLELTDKTDASEVKTFIFKQ